MLDLSQAVLTEAGVVGYRDHRSPDRVYVLPKAIALSQTEERPAFALFGYAGEYDQGWQLTLQLRLEPEAVIAPEVILLPIDRAWMRLKLAIQSEGDWQECAVQGDLLSGIALPLTAAAALQLEQLLGDETLAIEALQVEVKVQYQGLRATYPIVFSFSPANLNQYLMTATEAIEAVPIDTVLELHRRWLQTFPQSADAFAELELRLLELAWKPYLEGFRLKPIEQWSNLSADAMSGQLSWDLRVPIASEQIWQGNWQFSQFWRSLDAPQREKLFLRVPVPEALQPTPIHITTTIPLEKHQLRKVIVKLHYYGTSQAWEDQDISFDRSDQITQTVWTVLPYGANFGYYYSLEAFFDSPEQGGWPPKPIRTEPTRTSDPHLALTLDRLNLTALLIQVQTDALTGVGKIEVQLGNASAARSIALTRSRSRVAVLGASSFSTYRLLVHPPISGAPVQTLDWTTCPRDRLLITSFHTQVVQPDRVRLSIKPSEEFAIAAVLVWIKPATADASAGELITLDRSRLEASWSVWRADLFSPVRYCWRAELYFLPEARMQPIALPWTLESALDLVFDKLPEVT